MTSDTELPLKRVSLDTTVLICLVLQALHLDLFTHLWHAQEILFWLLLFLIAEKKIRRPPFVSTGGTAN